MDPNCIYELCLYCGIDEPCYKKPVKDKRCCEEHSNYDVDKYSYEWNKNERKYCAGIVNKSIKKSDQAKENHDRAIMANKVFAFLLKHKRFLFQHEGFAGVVYDKLLEFKEDKFIIDNLHLFDVNKYLHELYPLLFKQEFIAEETKDKKTKNKKLSFSDVVFHI